MADKTELYRINVFLLNPPAFFLSMPDQNFSEAHGVYEVHDPSKSRMTRHTYSVPDPPADLRLIPAELLTNQPKHRDIFSDITEEKYHYEK